MKITNYLIVFMIIVLSVLVAGKYAGINSLHTVSTEIIQYNQNIDSALEAAVDSVVEVSDGTLHYDKEVAVQEYLNSLYAAFGIADDEIAQNSFELYIPIIAIADVDGFYIRFTQKNEGRLEQVWTQKIPYSYTDSSTGIVVSYRLDDSVRICDLQNGNKVYEGDLAKLTTIYNQYDYTASIANRVNTIKNAECLSSKYQEFKHFAVTNTITEQLSYYVNLHNQVAEAYGFSYTFQLPETADSDLNRAVEDITFISLFQGFPIGSGTEKYYSRFAVAGARILKRNAYHLSEIDGLTFYHKHSCSLGENIRGVYYDKDDCAGLGAMPCPYCKP